MEFFLKSNSVLTSLVNTRDEKVKSINAPSIHLDWYTGECCFTLAKNNGKDFSCLFRMLISTHLRSH